MPMTKPKNVPVDECKEKCRVHKDEIMKYFCEDHGEVGCNVCVTLSHRTCNVGYIPTLAEDLFNNDEYKSFRRLLKSMSNRVSDCTDFAATYVRRIINDTDRNISAINKRRKEVNDFFDKLEREVKGELQQNMSKNLTKITQLLSSCNKLDVLIQQEQEDLNNKEDDSQKCCLFVDMKLVKKEVLDEFEKELIEIEKRPEHMSYIPSNETIHMACDTSAMLGVFVHHDSVVSVSESEKDISDIALLTNDQLVAVSNNSKCALIVNTEQRQITKSLSFPYPPFGLTKVSDRRFAAWYKNKIGIYLTDSKTQLCETINCPGLRWPIVYMNNTFIGFTELTGSYAVRIINARGDEIKTFPTGEDKKRNTFVDPQYIVVNQDNSLLYVTDNGGRIMKCLTMDGDVRAEFRPQHDWNPAGIATSHDGTVYVCDFMNNNIHILTFDLREVGVINGDMFGIKQPSDIVYCDANHKLYVGMQNSTNMVVLKVERPDKFLEDNNE